MFSIFPLCLRNLHDQIFPGWMIPLVYLVLKVVSWKNLYRKGTIISSSFGNLWSGDLEEINPRDLYFLDVHRLQNISLTAFLETNRSQQKSADIIMKRSQYVTHAYATHSLHSFASRANSFSTVESTGSCGSGDLVKFVLWIFCTWKRDNG